MTPGQFVEQVLHLGLGIRKLIVGENFVFGKERSGTIQDLIEFGKHASFEVEPFPPKCVGGEVVSSTRIRQCLVAGNVDEAAQCLGRPYTLQGTVIPGEKRGKALGWPTANVRLPDHRIHPADGVYAVRMEEEKGKCLNAIAYIGKHPTFYEGERLLEVHVFDQILPLYGKNIVVHFVAHIRGDRAFTDVGDLLAQMDQDGVKARNILQDSSWCMPPFSPADASKG